MKKLSVLIVTFIFVSAAIAQDYKSDAKTPGNQPAASYCAMLKDGKMMLMAEGKQVNSDVTLTNGTRIRTDATLIKKDKTEMALKNGECIDQDGNIITPKADRKMEDLKVPPK